MAVIDRLKETFRLARRRSEQIKEKDLAIQPPAGAPPSRNHWGPHILPLELPLILPHHRYNLAAQGWSTVTLSEEEERAIQLKVAIANLFEASRSFFDQPEAYKEQFATKFGSEEGWSSIPGEKEIIAIRSTQMLPTEFKDAAEAFWACAGDLLDDMLGSIAESLELEPSALTKFSKPCTRLIDQPTATMLRLFRYEGWEDKIVAEPHADLGLLSLVAGKSPGLQVWDGLHQRFYPIERSSPDLSSMASVLAGRELECLSNGKYNVGGHQVRSYADKSDQETSRQDTEKQYRFSIVFVLRAHSPVIIDADSLTSAITGVPKRITDGMTAKDLFLKIKGAHFNINSGIVDRTEQKRKLEEYNARKGGQMLRMYRDQCSGAQAN